MAISTTTFESTLQTKLNNTSLEAKEMLLLGKALESTVGSIAVSDINTAGANKVSEINAVSSNTFKTVGGASILGSGDISTLPSQTSNAQNVLTTDGTSASWLDNHEATQLFGTVLSSNYHPGGNVNAYENVTISLTQNMNNFRGLIFVGSGWSNMWYYPVSVLNNTVKMPSDSATGLADGPMHMLASYDTYHFYIRRVSDTQFWINSGTGTGLQQIFGVK